MSEEKKCLYPDCDKIPSCRGLCKNHYSTVRYHVSKGTHTWENLEERGKCLPAGQQGPKGGKIINWLNN
jgi:hypothetical protein